MLLEDTKISKAIIKTYNDTLIDALNSDVAIVGGGPSGLVAAYYLAKAGFRTTLFERNLSVGGGMWGGGMMMNQVVFQESAREIVEEFNINYKEYDKGYYTANSVECVSALSLKAVQAGAQVFNLISVEDVMTKNDSLAGLVINWTSVEMTRLHVDPLMVEAKYILDATGHDAVVTSKLVKKMGNILNTPGGGLEGEQPMWAERGEEQVVENTKEVYPGLFVSGMAANASFGGQRMGPVFGGMFLSGHKVAGEIINKLKGV